MPGGEVRYCTTEDGVRIAYAAWGDGEPLVACPGFLLQFSDFHRFPGVEEHWDSLARGRRVIWYDTRGGGLSERNVTDFSLEARVNDLSAVIAALRLRRVALYAGGDMFGGAVAVAYAARHPGQVSQLILYGSFIRGSDLGPPEVLSGLVEIARNNWNLAAQTMADMSTREQYGDVALQIAKLFRVSTTGETAASFLEQAFETDIGGLVGSLRVPTLVLHRREDALVPFSLGRELAAAIPDARFVPLEGSVHAEFLGDSEAVLSAITEFLGVRTTRREQKKRVRPVRETRDQVASGVRTVLFTDLVGHTEMMQRLGDERGRDVLREHERTTREVLKAHRGVEIKTDGDSFMVSFGSVTRAVECAVALQRAFAERNETAAEPLHVRVGLNAGEPIAEEGDLFGATVILASRVAAQAGAGEILIPEPVWHLLAGKEFAFSDRGEFVPKGFEDAVRLYEVRWRE